MDKPPYPRPRSGMEGSVLVAPFKAHLALIGLLATAIPAGWDASAQPVPATGPSAFGPASRTTDIAIGLFAEACILSTLIQEDPADRLPPLGFAQASPAEAAPFLMGVPGTAWLPSDPMFAGLPIAVVTRPAGVTCQVLTPLAVPEQAASGFRELMAGMASSGLTLQPELDSPLGPDSGPGHRLMYRATFQITGKSYHIGMSARPPVSGGIALFMTVSRAE